MATRTDKRYSKQLAELSVYEHLHQMYYHAYWAAQPGTQVKYHLDMVVEHKEEIERKLGFEV